MAASSRSTLYSLARLYNVQTSYYDVKGQRQQASTEGLVALLRALGAPLETSRDAPSALRERREHLWQQLLEPVTVAWEGALDLLELRLPAKLVDRSSRCSLRLETGEINSWTLKPGTLRVMKQQHIEGVGYAAHTLRMSGLRRKPLPYGYHHLTLDFGEHSSKTLLISAPVKAYRPTPTGPQRSWGVFLPLYALHRNQSWGAGDFSDLEKLIDWVAELGGEVVATLPLLAAFLDKPYEPSPYSPVSRLFWNEFYVDVTAIPEFDRCPKAQALLNSPHIKAECDSLRSTTFVDYRKQMAIKRQVLEELTGCLLEQPSERRESFQRFLQDQPDVEDYARFRATCEQYQTPWQVWPQRLRDGNLREGDYDERNKRYHVYAQWVAEAQLRALAARAGRTGHGLYLDLPLGVHACGYDVWRERAPFVMEATGGAPPDSVFTKGQDWAFAPLHPEGIRQQGYRYFIQCLRHHMREAGVLRIDHIMGLHRLYMIPKGLEPYQGAYVRYRAEELYAILTLESHRHQTWLVGENLGTVPSYVNAALARHRVHPMYVIQYELTPQASPVLRPVPRGAVASLNTHDMPPFTAYCKGLDVDDRLTMGLLDQTCARTERQTRQTLRKALEKFLREKGFLPTRSPEQHQLLQGCLNFLGASEAALVLVNLEDLWLETEPQNVPGSKESQPNWTRKGRYSVEAFSSMLQIMGQIQKINRLRKGKTKHGQQNHGHAPTC